MSPTTTAAESLANAARIEPRVAQLDTGVVLLDEALCVAYINPALVELLGLASARVFGAGLHLLGPEAERLIESARRAQQEQRVLRLRGCLLGSQAEYQVRADVSLSPITTGVLLEVHALASGEDAAYDPQLQASLRGLAHEVKNPLAGMRGAAQLLGRHLHGEPELAKLVSIIIDEADRLAALTNRLLHAGDTSAFAHINIHEVTERVRTLVLAEAGQAARIERDYDPSLPLLQAHADRLLQLVLNLVRNALEAGATLIRLRTRIDYGVPLTRAGLRLEVIDDGRGVADDLQPLLFQPLVSGRAQGTGLGLALAQQIAREHGGVITCYSRPGHTVFTLALPLGEQRG